MSHLKTPRERARIRQAHLPLPRRRFTREEYHKLAELGILREDERVELIEGEIIKMAPASPEHVAETHSLYDRLRRLFGKSYTVRLQAPLALGDSEPEPDLAVVQGAAKDYLHAHPTHAVLVVEVAQTSLQYDREVKSSLYAKAGIPEYWIINLQSRQLEVYRDPAESPEARYGYQYQTQFSLTSKDTIAPLARPERAIRVARLFTL